MAVKDIQKDKHQEAIDAKIKHYLSGLPTRYDEKVHLPLLHKTFVEDMDGIEAFCYEASICRDTFNTWCKAHPIFGKTYKNVLDGGAKKWLRLPLEREIESKYWAIMCKNRYKFIPPKPKIGDEKKPIDIIHAALDGWERGELTAEEVNKLSNVALNKANIESGNFNGVPSTAIRSMEETRALLDKVEQAITVSKEKAKKK